MASFSAYLHVNGHVYPLRHCTYSFTQATGSRGRPSAKVRPGKAELVLDVPHDHFLGVWAAAKYKPLPGYIVFYDGAGGPLETLSWEAGHCVGYREVFTAGSATEGAYICFVTIAAQQLVLTAGGPPTPFVAPAAREHGQPPAAATTPRPAISSACSEAERLRLQSLVDSNCKKSKLKCISTDSCPKMESEMQAINDCIAARTKINMKCFKGGDPGHNQQITDKIQSLLYCQELYARKCGNAQQPQPFPAPVALPKVDPKVPVVLTGTALLLYYLLEVLEAALIIL